MTNNSGFFNAKPLSSLIDDYVSHNPVGEALACAEIAKNAQMVFGPLLAGKLTVLFLKNGTLFLKPANSACRQEAEISKAVIIKRANVFSTKFPVTDIKFKQ